MTARAESRASRPESPAMEAAVVLRAATPEDAAAIHALIDVNLESGHLLPRTIEELRSRARRFLVVAAGERIVGCAELAPLSRRVAEVRSLVVDAGRRRAGLGTRLLDALTRWAREEGFETLCAFTHDPGPFVRLGFSIVPHVWVPEKIATDCHRCPLFRGCGQYAVVYSLARSARDGRRSRVDATAAASTGLFLQPLPV